MFGQQSRGHLAKAYMRETWACCMRFSQAAVATANADPGCAKRLPYVAKLAESMKPLLPHSKDHQLELPHRGNSRAHRDAHKLAGLRFTRSVGLADKPCGRAGIGAAIFTKNLLISAFVGPWKRRQFLLYSRCCSGVGKLGKQRSIKRLFSRRPRLPCEFLIPAGGEGYEL